MIEERNLCLPRENVTPALVALGFQMIAQLGDRFQKWINAETGKRLVIPFRYGNYIGPKTLSALVDASGEPIEKFEPYCIPLPSSPGSRQSQLVPFGFPRLSKYADPFEINDEIRGVADDLVKDFSQVTIYTIDTTACRIFTWVLENITYGTAGQLGYGVRYRTPLETYEHREGICGEMAFLTLAMCRHVGIESYVVVTGEKLGGPADHAFVGVVVGGRVSLYDPATKYFDTEYFHPCVWDDDYATYAFNVWRNTNPAVMPESPKYVSPRARELTSKLDMHDLSRLHRKWRKDWFDYHGTLRQVFGKRSGKG